MEHYFILLKEDGSYTKLISGLTGMENIMSITGTSLLDIINKYRNDGFNIIGQGLTTT